jgi:hypothetical protein
LIHADIYTVWGKAFSIIATLKGIGQMSFCADYAEQASLNNGGAETHILFGKLRFFHFFSDALCGKSSDMHGSCTIIYPPKKALTKIFFLSLVFRASME